MLRVRKPRLRVVLCKLNPTSLSLLQPRALLTTKELARSLAPRKRLKERRTAHTHTRARAVGWALLCRRPLQQRKRGGVQSHTARNQQEEWKNLGKTILWEVAGGTTQHPKKSTPEFEPKTMRSISDKQLMMRTRPDQHRPALGCDPLSLCFAFFCSALEEKKRPKDKQTECREPNAACLPACLRKQASSKSLGAKQIYLLPLPASFRMFSLPSSLKCFAATQARVTHSSRMCMSS